MAFWFLANFEAAMGYHFKLAEAAAIGPGGPDAAATFAATPIAMAPRYGGRGQAVFFDGGRSEPLLRDEFGGHVASEVIAEAAGLFGGLWQRMPLEIPELHQATDAEARAALGAALDAFETMFRAVVPEHGGIGHNGPPDDPVTPEDRDAVLRALAGMRMAVSAGADASVLEAVWSGVSAVVAKVGGWAARHFNLFFDNFTPQAGKSFAVAAPILLAGVALWYKGASVSDLFALAAKLAK